ncbi:dihydrofolate reductase family protein [Actinomadura barringtoniae]|uniref:Dihydrofolate reductase family protein n=1 Tax=Actinomadura barringtoniae TaxID=1427535 RepID=A0A939T8Z6_9ACTN|nr:dihydrofolate reductase family protein [Actinomadura barringtoniae]MBO2447445.1 dihydrofolate reductase family protein [Actinomadura barringtoniae]
MRKIINSTYITLDGVIQDPQNWTATFFDETAGELAAEQVFASDALIMGRATYDGFAAAWPHMEEQTGDFGVRMNTMPKYAVSTTLKDPEWKNTTVISDNVVERIRALKEEPGQDIMQYGFGSVSKLMLDNGLLDELRLWIHPVFAGARTPEDVISVAGAVAKFDLAGTRTLQSGVIVATYTPKAAE